MTTSRLYPIQVTAQQARLTALLLRGHLHETSWRPKRGRDLDASLRNLATVLDGVQVIALSEHDPEAGELGT